MTLSCVAIVALSYYLYKTHKVSKLQNIAVAFIIGGGIGNMIDRVLLGYVIDFIDFCAFPKIWYYTFNVADSFVCVGAGLMFVYLLRDIIREIKAEKASKASAEQATPCEETAQNKDAE
jgi:signal peptidase II